MKKLHIPNCSASLLHPGEPPLQAFDLQGRNKGPGKLVEDNGLSAEDRAFLREREDIVRLGKKAFLEVGTALIEICDYKRGLLYKPRYGTFTQYLGARWDFGAPCGYRMMAAAFIYMRMLSTGEIPRESMPTTERQFRELARLPGHLHVAAWKALVAAAGENPISTREVEKQVRALNRSEALARYQPRT